MNNSSQTALQRIEAIASALLPPSKRDQVLGDLAERFTQDGRTASYLLLAIQVVPPIAWRALLRRELTRPLPVGYSGPVDSLRRRAEQLQDELWQHRTWRDLLLVVMWGFAFAPVRWNDLYITIRSVGAHFVLILFTVDAFKRWRRFQPRAIPPGFPLSDLIPLHRRALLARRLSGLSLILWVPTFLVLPALSGSWAGAAVMFYLMELTMGAYFVLPLMWATNHLTNPA